MAFSDREENHGEAQDLINKTRSEEFCVFKHICSVFSVHTVCLRERAADLSWKNSGRRETPCGDFYVAVYDIDSTAWKKNGAAPNSQN